MIITQTLIKRMILLLLEIKKYTYKKSSIEIID